MTLLMNGCSHSMSAAAAGLAYVLITHSYFVDVVGRLSTSEILAKIAPAGMAATAVFFLVSTWATAAIVASSRPPAWRRSMPVLKVWHEYFYRTAPQFLISGSCVILGLAVLQNEDWWLAVLVLPPIWLVSHAHRLYMEGIRRDLQHTHALNNLNNSFIASLATVMYARDRDTTRRHNRVQHYALEIATYLKLAEEVREAIRCAAIVQDIGEIGVPDDILKKTTILTGEERRRMRQHVRIGAAILQPVQFPWPVVEVVEAHHERWDGLGYPNGLKGEEIPIGARVIALADAFEGLMTDRPDRKAMSTREALDHVTAASGSQFDPKAVEALAAVIGMCEARIASTANGYPGGPPVSEAQE